MMQLLRRLIAACMLVMVNPVFAADDPELAHVKKMQSFIELMQGFYSIIETNHGIADDPEKAAVLQLHKIEEIYKERGERAKAIEEFYSVLAKSRNQAIRNATYVMLGEALKETGRADEAVKVLKKGLDENIELSQ